jgi:thiol-disulfide isomerase/thioredoxin
MRPGRREALILGAVALAAAGAGVLVGPLLLQSRSGAADLLGATFPDLEGKPRRLIEWQGQVLVCNFWATWCAPCREEVPVLIEARRQHAAKGLEIVGIAIDQPDKVQEFAKSFGISYPILFAGADVIELMRKLGNGSGALPYTVILDRGGTLAYRHLGAVSREQLESALSGLLG